MDEKMTKKRSLEQKIEKSIAMLGKIEVDNVKQFNIYHGQLNRDIKEYRDKYDNDCLSSEWDEGAKGWEKEKELKERKELEELIGINTQLWERQRQEII